MDQEKTKVKTNWFVRASIILLCLFIGTLICFNFFWSSSFAQISTGLLVLIAFLTVLVLSESFDNFSIFKLISLSKKIEEKEKENICLKTDNSELRNQISLIFTNINQKQAMYNVLPGGKLIIKQADESEKQEKQEEIEQEDKADLAQKPLGIIPKKHISIKECEKIALEKFLSKKKLSKLPILNAKIINQFQQIDPISEHCPIFDAYIKTIDKEIFIEMRLNRGIFLMFRDRLYLMLSKIYHYKTIKHANAYLFLVLINMPDLKDERKERVLNAVDRLRKEFEPSIANGLLRIEEIEITEEENQKILNEQVS